MIQTKMILAAELIVALLSTPAVAQCDPMDFVLDGFFVRGSLICDQSWLHRHAPNIVEKREKDCIDTDDKIIKGMLDFDSDLHRKGYGAACKDLDRAMTAIENGGER